MRKFPVGSTLGEILHADDRRGLVLPRSDTFAASRLLNLGDIKRLTLQRNIEVGNFCIVAKRVTPSLEIYRNVFKDIGSVPRIETHFATLMDTETQKKVADRLFGHFVIAVFFRYPIIRAIVSKLIRFIPHKVKMRVVSSLYI